MDTDNKLPILVKLIDAKKDLSVQVHPSDEKGILLAEIQESSNLTYRLYDYNRKDKNGKLRELHIDKAMDDINNKASGKFKQPMRLFQYKNGCSQELSYRCKYFEVHKSIINTEKYKKMYDYQIDNNSFHVLLCIDGCGTIINDEENIYFFKGDCIFIPANSVNLKIHGITTLLDINC